LSPHQELALDTEDGIRSKAISFHPILAFALTRSGSPLETSRLAEPKREEYGN